MNRSGWKQLAAVPSGLVLALLLAAPAIAQKPEFEPLARYLPAEGLSILLEHNGLEAQVDAWKGTATYKLLHETSLGAMLEDITAQLADRGLQSMPGAKATGKDVVALLNHLLNKGFVIGVNGSFQSTQTISSVVVIRDAGKSQVFKALLAKSPSLQEPVAKPVELPGGRKAFTIEGTPIQWWFEKDDFVIAVVPPNVANPTVAAIDAKVPNAVTHPARTALMKGEAGQTAVGMLFVDLKAFPPLPPQAAQYGLDGITGIEASWGIQGKATLTMLGVKAPRPRRGILALFDQPPIGPKTRFANLPETADFTLLSVDALKLVDAVLAMAKQNDPNATASIRQFAERFQQQTGLNLRDDLIAKVGPRMALTRGSGGGISSIMAMWFHPPDFGLVAELKDPKGFSGSLDRLMVAANRELKAAGAIVRPSPDQPARSGTEFAEFRSLNAPEHGYVLAVPPSVLPTPVGFRPTILINSARGVVAIGGSLATARNALGKLILDGSKGEPVAYRDEVLISQSDPREMLPELLASIPSLVQVIGLAASQTNGPGQPGRDGRPPFRLAIDPDAIPDVESMRGFLFPSKFALSVNNDTIRMSGYQAFPIPLPQLNVGMESPVLIALLLPAVQSAREAARRAQCSNNLKQIGLAMHNYNDSNNGFPARTIVDKAGKPLLSWRVSILPFIEQNALYQKFKLDEPWDSPHNKELIKYMPSTYACPSRNTQAETGLTTYCALSGKGTLLSDGRLTRLAEITDGMSNTLMVLESTNPVTWTKPDDLPFDEAQRPEFKPIVGAGSMHPGGFNALFADGSVKFIKLTIHPMVLRALSTKSGGEIISADAY